MDHPRRRWFPFDNEPTIEPAATGEPTIEPTPTEESTLEPTPTEGQTPEPTPVEEPTPEPTPTSESTSIPAVTPITGPGIIYIADTFNSRIVYIEDMDGTNWTTFETCPGITNELNMPYGVFIYNKGGRLF